MAIILTLKELAVSWGKQQESAPKRWIIAGAVGSHGEALDPAAGVGGGGQAAG